MRNSLLLLSGLLFTAASASAQFSVEPAFPNIAITYPVDLHHAGDGTNRIFVVDLQGIIYVFPNDPNVTSATVFLDIRDRVSFGVGEKGLLGMAFHPDYENNGYFYVRYSTLDGNSSTVSRFQVSASDPNVADPNSELIVLPIFQTADIHYGGQLAFGPNDGYLYISTGDGYGAGDPNCDSQSLKVINGKMLRIDVDNPSGGRQYGIPPDNPYAGNTEGYREEIYALGFRNPWRFSIDPLTNMLWAGDVGQNTYEEIDIVELGKNYGWNSMEGKHCFVSPWSCTPPCDTTVFTLPIWEYSHEIGQAVMGGYVYRGSTVPELAGKYIYADYATGKIYSLVYDGVNPPINTEIVSQVITPAGFGVDQFNELYFCLFQPTGGIWRFTPTYDPQPPVVGDIPDMSISYGTRGFPPINSDAMVTDPDSPDSTIIWTWTGNVHYTVLWSPTRRRLKVNTTRGWIGSETIVFTATDPSGLSDSDSATFTVTASSASLDGTGDVNHLETDASEIPLTTDVFANYPNPFNPSTTIHFDMSHDAWASLKVYNLLGEEIATLVDGPQTAGHKSVTWDGKRSSGQAVAGGTYLYVLAVDGTLHTGKMILLK